MKKGESIAIWETGEAGWHDQRKAVRQDDTASWVKKRVVFQLVNDAQDCIAGRSGETVLQKGASRWRGETEDQNRFQVHE